MRGCRRWSGVECDRVPPPRASPAARGKCGERVPSFPPLSSFYLLSVLFSCALSLSPSFSLSLFLSFSFSFALLFSPSTLHLPHPPHLTLPPPVRAQDGSRGGYGGPGGGGVDRNQYKTGLHVLHPSPMQPSLSPSLPSLTLSHPRSLALTPRLSPLPPSLTSSTPTFLILSTAPCSLEGGLAHIYMHIYTHTHTCINIRLYVYGEHQRAGKPSISVQGVFRYATGDLSVLLVLVAQDKVAYQVKLIMINLWKIAILQNYFIFSLEI